MLDAALRLWRELVRRNRSLAVLGLVHFALFAGLIVLATFDNRQITGLNRWVKPGKFAVSVGVYAWTFAWYLGYLKGNAASARFIGRGIALCMYVEMFCVVMQAARGKISHFNTDPGFDGAVFSLMGILIVVNTLLVIYGLLLFLFARVELPSAYLWGIRLGILIFILAGLEGFVMTGQRAHTVGLPDGGPGIPILNWSTTGGDLRVAHFIGLHALQVIPLVGYLLSRRGPTPLLSPAGWTGVVAVAYSLFVAGLFMQAMHGQPLIPIAQPTLARSAEPSGE
jgi:hypothetical protein